MKQPGRPVQKWIRHNSLFLKIFSICTSAILVVGIIISLVVVNHSQAVFIRSYAQANDKVLTQVQQDYMQLNEDALNLLNTCDKNWQCQQILQGREMSETEKYNNVYKMQQQIESATPAQTRYTPNLILIGLTGEIFMPNNAVLTQPVGEIWNSEFIRTAKQNPYTIQWQYIPDGFTSSTTGQSCIAATKLLTSRTSNAVYGLAILLITQSEFAGYYRNLTDGSINDVYVISDVNGSVVSSNMEQQLGQKRPELKALAAQAPQNNKLYQDVELGGVRQSILSKKLPLYNFHLISSISQSALLQQTYQPELIFLICALFILLMMVALFFIIRKTTRPITRLAHRMPQIVGGNFSHHIEVEGSGEVRQLAAAFNKMLDGLNSYVKQLVQAQEEKRAAEIHALQMQINPHFMYNTLACIKFLVWDGNIDKSIATIDAFISLLRNTISNKQEIISIAQEVDNLENYAKIQQASRMEEVQLTCTVDPDCRQLSIPKMLLQPLVENAFFHAFQEKGGGRIFVFIKQSGGSLLCEIADNGCGMDEQQVKNLLSGNTGRRHFTGIGVHNVNDRIKLIYGPQYGIEISSTIGEGTIIKVAIPARPLPEEDPDAAAIPAT